MKRVASGLAAWLGLPVRQARWIWLAGLVMLFFLVGYRGTGPDHAQYLLPVMSAVDPEFCASDWFVQETTHYNYLYQIVLTPLARLGLLNWGLLLWHLATLGFIVFGLYLWVRGLNGPVGLFFVVLALVYGGMATGWGNYRLLHQYAIPSALAGGGLLCFFAALLDLRLLTAAVFWGIGVYVHPAAAIVAALAAAPVTLLSLRENRPPRGTVLSILFILLLTVPMFIRVFSDFGGGENSAAEKIFFLLRSSHHYAPHRTGWETQLRSIFLLIAAFTGFWLTGPGGRRRRLIVWEGTLVFLFAMAILCLEVINFSLLVKLFPFRLLPVLWALGLTSLLAAVWDGTLPPWRRWTGAGGVVACLVHGFSPWGGWILLLTTLALFTGLRRARFPAAGWSRQLTWVVALLVLLVAAKRSPGGRHMSLWPKTSPVYTQLAASVAVDEVVMIPPAMQGFRLSSGRSAYVDFKCFPVKADEMIEWKRRIEVVAGEDPMALIQGHPPTGEILKRLTAGYHDREVDALLEAARAEGIDRLLVEAGSRFDRTMRPQVEADLVMDGYALYSVDQCVVNRAAKGGINSSSGLLK